MFPTAEMTAKVRNYPTFKRGASTTPGTGSSTRSSPAERGAADTLPAQASRETPGSPEHQLSIVPPHPRQSPNATFVALSAGALAYVLLQSLVVPALPTLQVALHTSQSTVSWIYGLPPQRFGGDPGARPAGRHVRQGADAA